MYNLVDTVTLKVIKRNIDLTKSEVDVLNYAYALNNAHKKYVAVEKPKKNYTTTDEKSVELFKFKQPI
jgi:hypothetical protein